MNTVGRNGRPNGARVYRSGFSTGPHRRYRRFRDDGPARAAPAARHRTPCRSRDRGRSARLRHRSWDPSPPSSGSSNASSSGRPRGCSDTKLQPIQVQRGSSGRWSPSGSATATGRSSRTGSPSASRRDDLTALREAHPTLAADLADAALGVRPRPRLPPRRPTDRRARRRCRRSRPATSASRRASTGAAESPRHADRGAAAADGARRDDAIAAAAPTQTAVFVVPAVEAPRATLREIRPDGSTRTFVVDGRPLTIGRGPDNGLVLADGRASRHHARIYGRAGRAAPDRPRQHERLVGQRPARRGDRARGGRPDPDRRHAPRRRVGRRDSLIGRLIRPSRSGSSGSCSSPCSTCSCSGSPGRSSATCARPPASRRRSSAGSSSSPRRRRAGRGQHARPRRDHDARPRRQQRDRRRRPVRLGGARGPDVPRPGLVRRGPREHERHVRQRRAGRGRRRRSASATRSRSARSGSGSSDRGR